MPQQLQLRRNHNNHNATTPSPERRRRPPRKKQKSKDPWKTKNKAKKKTANNNNDSDYEDESTKTTMVAEDSDPKQTPISSRTRSSQRRKEQAHATTSKDLPPPSASLEDERSHGAGNRLSPKTSEDSEDKSTKTTMAEDGDDDDNDDVATQKSASKRKLELVKAKLEKAKQRRLSLQEENGSNQQKEEGTDLSDDTGANATTKASKKVGSAKMKTSEEVQAALQRAREKLQGAMTNRERALQNVSAGKNVSSTMVAPISGLGESLIVKNLSQTGPESMVYFPSKTAASDLGRRILEDRMNQESMEQRRVQLQQELMALKERLEQKQKNASDLQMQTSKHQQPVMTKEELRRRKDEAQAMMDLSYWKHFVSKQEVIMSDVDKQVDDTRKAVESCTREMQEASTHLDETELLIRDIELRQQTITDMITKATSALLETRQKVHLEKLRTK